MSPPSHIDQAVDLMTSYAERTGISSGGSPQRYLWTDAFAVCNFLGLAAATGDEQHTEVALKLVDQVHQTLGRHRPDSGRTGWISGLSEDEGLEHPTRGGLRIGKPLAERSATAGFDEALEWERDGQYFHYLTKWMHALDQVARATGEPRYNLWARELAQVAFEGFAYPAGGHLRLAWKKSVDLSRVLVPSMGQHDPLDGLVTYAELRATSAHMLPPQGPDLRDPLTAFASMMGDGGEWTTADPLGIGGLLIDACRVDQLRRLGAFSDERVLEALLAAARASLLHYTRLGEVARPTSTRLAFRELVLAIGFSALALIDNPRARPLLEALRSSVGLGNAIETCWLDPVNQKAPGFAAHRDLDEVMLATRLVPEGFLVL